MENAVVKNSLITKLAVFFTAISVVRVVGSFVLCFYPLQPDLINVLIYIYIGMWAIVGVLCLGLPFISTAYITYGERVISAALKSGTPEYQLTVVEITGKVFPRMMEATFVLLILSIVITLLKKNDKYTKNLRITNYVLLGLMTVIFFYYMISASIINSMI
jgi:predicted membrane channel-forming protein YqfA (hemolysin III family)